MARKTLAKPESVLPPARGGRSQQNYKEHYDWEEIADQLRAVPLEWRKITDRDKYTISVMIGNGHVAPLRDYKGFEKVTRDNQLPHQNGLGHRTCSVWMRYNPELDQEK